MRRREISAVAKSRVVNGRLASYRNPFSSSPSLMKASLLRRTLSFLAPFILFGAVASAQQEA
ncbi:MAG: hypothetical protein ACKPB0_14170, partial [Opitutaceae bacterium]